MGNAGAQVWRKAVGCIPTFMVDTFIHIIPVLRDCVQWLGTREVSRKAIDAALDRKESGRSIASQPGSQPSVARLAPAGLIPNAWACR